jgi:carbon-monoxide dehydrogenase small subunit
VAWREREIRFLLNGETVEVRIEARQTLLSLLRDTLELTGTKESCGIGECGACTVLLEGRAVTSCLVPAFEVDGLSVRTIDGLAQNGVLHPVQRAFVEHGAVQCGFCIPGMIMSSVGLLERTPHPTEEEIRTALVGNLCRCTGYVRILEAVKAASRAMGEARRGA